MKNAIDKVPDARFLRWIQIHTCDFKSDKF